MPKEQETGECGCCGDRELLDMLVQDDTYGMICMGCDLSMMELSLD